MKEAAVAIFGEQTQKFLSVFRVADYTLFREMAELSEAGISLVPVPRMAIRSVAPPMAGRTLREDVPR